ncbi:MAG: EF-P lysine aminoacylase EpmA [Gammaproteobacteria bacterium]|nr:EF-P lysine aminoacylase EpmA [Gammaproteobacteria bacterium]
MTEHSDWQATASLKALRLRADCLSRIRSFFDERTVLEVETPLLSQYGTTDPHIDSLRVSSSYQDQTRYLHTSPEFAMKRLLATGSGPIYQICKVFRDAEIGRRHNPEFTLLEWYRPGFDQNALMAEVEALVRQLLATDMELAETLSLRYTEAFERYLGIDPLAATVETLAQLASEYGIDIEMDSDEAQRDDWLDLLISQVIEPQLPKQQPVFITHFPASQASLARLDPSDARFAHRFELYLGGMELANGFHELTDPTEQALRFQAERAQRREAGKWDVPEDQHLLAALQQGLPDSAGVALGLDRLLMLALGSDDIADVIAFPFERA